MHLLKNSIGGPLGLVLGLAVLVAIAVLPTFGGDSEAAGGGILLNRTSATSEFLIPGVPVDSLAAPVGAAEQTPPAFLITINGNNTTFPIQGDLLFGLDKGVGGANNELMAYTRATVAPPAGCGTVAKNQLCITNRAKDPGGKKDQAPGTLIQLATQLFQSLPAATGAECNLSNQISTTVLPSFKLTCTASADAFGAAGYLSISQGDTQTPNVGGLTGEMMQYTGVDDSACGAGTLGVNDLCIIDRALQNDNTKYLHKPNGYTTPCSEDGNWFVRNPDGSGELSSATNCPELGRSVVSKQFMIKVKSNDGFFPAGNLMVCPANPQTWVAPTETTVGNCELLGHNNALSKIPPAPISTHVKDCKAGGNEDCDEFYITSRGASTALFQRTGILSHAQGAIVTGAHGQLVCRNSNYQPGVDLDPDVSGAQEPAGQKAGTSVAAYPACQTRTQPDSWPKTLDPKKLGVPLAGQDLIVLMRVGLPFLSTGGFQPALPGWSFVDHIDTDGTAGGNPDTNTCTGAAAGNGDTQLCLASPCIVNYTPGTNLQVEVRLRVDNDYTTPDDGLIKVILDTVPTTPAHTECDDPAGWGPITVTTYSYYDPNAGEDGFGAGTCSDGIDNDGSSAQPDGTRKDTTDFDCYFTANGGVHDTDGDNCSDTEEGFKDEKKGGARDAWNPYDFFDFNNDGYIDSPNDILQVMLRYSANPGLPYNIKADVGLPYGPFSWNRAAPNGSIDAPNDITAVKFSYQNDCRPAP